MKTGNTAQAVVLTIAALGALGFLGSRLLPSGPKVLGSTSSSDRGSGGQSALQEGLPTDVVRDAFSHPALTKRFLASKTNTGQQEAETPIEPQSLPQVSPLMPDMSPELRGFLQRPTNKPDKDKPSGSTGTNQQEEKTPKTKIGLKAIMRTTKPLALMTLDGGTLPFISPGDQLNATYRVTKFTQNAVWLESRTEKFKLYVGEEIEK